MKIISISKNKPIFPSFSSIPHKNIKFILYNVNPSSHKNIFVMPVYHKLYTANHYYNHTKDIMGYFYF